MNETYCILLSLAGKSSDETIQRNREYWIAQTLKNIDGSEAYIVMLTRYK